MVRLKFVLFALPVIGLWVAHLYLVSPLMTEGAIEEVGGRARAAPAAVAEGILQRRVELQRLALRAASAPAAAALSAGKTVTAPSPDKLGALASTLKDAAPEAVRAGLVVGVVNEAGTLYVRGDEKPASDAQALDLKPLGEAGADGLAQDAFGAPYLFYSVPLPPPDKTGRIVLGAPVVDPQLVEKAAKEANLSALALVTGGKLLAAGGPDKAAAAQLEKTAQPGRTVVVKRGSVLSAGPLQLPLWTERSGGVMGNAPLQVAARQAIPTTPYEVISVASAASFMNALAFYQRTALFALAALILLAAVWTLLIGSGRAEAGAGAEFGPELARTVESQLPSPAPAEAEAEAAPQEPGTIPPLAMPEPPAEASPDDFPFGAPPAPAAAEAQAPWEESPTTAAPPPAPPAPANPFDFPDENQPTKAYSTAPEMNESTGAPGFPDPGLPPPDDFNPEATRVAAIPDELLRQSARPSKPEMPTVQAPRASALPPPRVAVPVATNAATADEAHFQDVYKTFVATREKCGEPADGLTFEKFAVKLRKNRDQLIEKYSCRTVRFQVYVKEGKAALKATPVKD